MQVDRVFICCENVHSGFYWNGLPRIGFAQQALVRETARHDDLCDRCCEGRAAIEHRIRIHPVKSRKFVAMIHRAESEHAEPIIRAIAEPAFGDVFQMPPAANPATLADHVVGDSGIFLGADGNVNSFINALIAFKRFQRVVERTWKSSLNESR
jgi:hypothetical protein